MSENKLYELFLHYLEHQDEYVRQYNGKAIALGEAHEVIGAYDSEWDAVKEVSLEREPGSFIVQMVTPGTSAYSLSLVW